MTEFSMLNLAEPIAIAIEAEGYAKPTPIQAQAIPPILDGRDLVGVAQTGTGKTAAFALPILDRLARNRRPLTGKSMRVLVLAPTRELAAQIGQSFAVYGRNIRISVQTIFGGVPINRQVRDMQRGADIVVATPGRLIDLIDRRAISLSQVEIVVLDEADQMLDLGFIHAIRRIMPMLPKERQNLLFSATMPKTISALADDYLTSPARVAVAPPSTTAERVAQKAFMIAQSDKQALLARLLQETGVDRAIVFTRTKHGADRVVKNLERVGLASVAIHGNKSQGQRERALDSFRDGRTRILVATDIAARGLDIEAVSHVFNFEIPNVPEQYVHRIGRTARAGASGLAVSFVAAEERAFLRDIEKLTRIKIEIAQPPEGFVAEAGPQAAPRAERDRPRKPHRGRGGPNNAQRSFAKRQRKKAAAHA
jgi:ATP-dependent RNA helicase RhlE